MVFVVFVLFIYKMRMNKNIFCYNIGIIDRLYGIV